MSVHPPLQLVINLGARRGKPFARPSDEPLVAAIAVFPWRQHFRSERLRIGVILKQLHHRLVPVKIGKGAGRDGCAELLFHHLGISIANAEGNQGADIADRTPPV